MRTERLPVVFTVLGVIVGTIGGLLAAPIAILGGGLLAVAGAIWQDRMGKPFVR
jgi:hypothetical protein